MDDCWTILRGLRNRLALLPIRLRKKKERLGLIPQPFRFYLTNQRECLESITSWSFGN
jgi:hypothetical protein